jgi:hypothetical protein
MLCEGANMARAGYCSECEKNVWLTEEGCCEFGHKPGSISGAYTPVDVNEIPSVKNDPKVEIEPKMVKAGHCSECNKNVYLTGDGHCQFGHAPRFISNVYETPETTPVKGTLTKTHKMILGITGIVVVLAIISTFSSGSNADNAAQDTSSSPSTSTPSTSETTTTTPAAAPKPTPPPVRQVVGVATTLGAGTFTGGQDVQMGLYDVTPGSGESGNFFVHGYKSYNELLGADTSMGYVPIVRVRIAAGDKVEISGLSTVTFTPVTAPFVTAHAAATLYAGRFTVGEDIGAGRYVVTPGSGESGNFFVHGSNSVNELLGGDTSMGYVPSIAVDLTDGDEIEISGLSQVVFTPSD